ncbi:MAG TPA: GNAT family N-acetyltransferase [Nitrococcus sp.]|nr:GNAT family N-acetyltransferase [Nitrococcus sp.]
MVMKALYDEFALTLVDRPRGADWSAFADLYQEVFPPWEREPLLRVATRVTTGRYRLTVLRLADEPVAGFHLLDQVVELDYAVLTFLALRQAFRGRGLGQRLLQDAVSRFQTTSGPTWLFVEAEAGPAHFYQSYGFRRLILDYRVPHYGSGAAIQSMALLTVHRDGRVSPIDGKLIRRIIEHLFVDGYQVRPDDPRLAAQLQRVPDIVGVG